MLKYQVGTEFLAKRSERKMTNFVLLRQQMIANDMQQKDLAEAAGLSRSALSARMHRRADFTTGEMLRIGKVLGLQPDDYYRVFLAESAAGLEGKKA
jgi:plasmid maintenance system antidote protein VapI